MPTSGRSSRLRHDGTAAWLTRRLNAYRQPSWMKQWPFAHTVEMTYRLQDGVLEVRTKVVNLSTEPMPGGTRRESFWIRPSGF